jgi:tetratricopeptide (TPR) repeat protein
MDLAAFIYNRLLNIPDRGALFVTLAVGCGVILFAVALLLGGKLRWFARIVGLLGVAIVMLALWTFHEQTIIEKQGPRVTVTRMRYTEGTRTAVRAALLAMPVVAGWVMLSMWRTDRRDLRATVPLHLKQGRKHQVQKEYDAALREYNQAIRIAPELGEAYCGRGIVYQAMGDTVRALADFDRALAHDSRLAPAYLARGKIRTERGDLDGALADFGELMRIQPTDPESHLNRGICLEKKGLVGEAIADFERVLKLTNHPDFAEPATDHLFRCQHRAGQSSRSVAGNGAPGLPRAPETQAEEFRN